MDTVALAATIRGSLVALAGVGVTGWGIVWWEQVIGTEPVITWASSPEPPEPPSQVEWRTMYVRLRTVGSTAVAAEYEQFDKNVRGFLSQAWVVRTIRQQGGGGQGDLMKAWEALEQVRATVRETYERLVNLASAELAAL